MRTNATERKLHRPRFTQAFLALSVVLAVCQFAPFRPANALDGEGSQEPAAKFESRKKEWPVRAIYVPIKKSAERGQFGNCSGAFIGNNTFLTAYHCVTNQEKNQPGLSLPENIIFPRVLYGHEKGSVRYRTHRGAYLIVPKNNPAADHPSLEYQVEE